MARSITAGRNGGSGDLDGGDLGPGSFGAVMVDEPGGLEHEQARLLDLDAGAGDKALYDPLLDDRPAERHP